MVPEGKLVKLEPVREAPEPLRPLATSGRNLWDRIWATAYHWVSITDIETVQIVCEQLDERVALRIQVLRERNRYDRIGLRQLDMQVLAGLGALGLTPVDRGRLGVAEVNRVSKLDAMRRRAGND